MFWLKQLHEIKEEAKQGGDNKLAEDVADAIDRMMYHAEELNSHVLRVYESGGPALHEDRHLLCLKKLLRSQGDDDVEEEQGRKAKRRLTSMRRWTERVRWVRTLFRIAPSHVVLILPSNSAVP